MTTVNVSGLVGMICIAQATESWKLTAYSDAVLECLVSFTFQLVLCKSCETEEQEQESNNFLLLLCTHIILFAKTFLQLSIWTSLARRWLHAMYVCFISPGSVETIALKSQTLFALN